MSPALLNYIKKVRPRHENIRLTLILAERNNVCALWNSQVFRDLLPALCLYATTVDEQVNLLAATKRSSVRCVCAFSSNATLFRFVHKLTLVIATLSL